jgi:hypothetical protein
LVPEAAELSLVSSPSSSHSPSSLLESLFPESSFASLRRIIIRRGRSRVRTRVRARSRRAAEGGDGRAGEGIRASLVPDVDVDTSIFGLVATRERGGNAGSAGVGATNGPLRAAWVELGAVGLIGEMKSDNLVTDQVVARREVLGKLNVVLLALVEDGVLVPLIAGGLGLANLVDLEELGLGSVHGRAISIALSHVGDKRTRIVRPGRAITTVPGEAKGVAGVGFTVELGTTGGSTFAAGEVLAILDVVGLGVVDAADDRIGTGPGLRTDVFLAVDSDFGDESVGEDGGEDASGGDGEKSEGLHGSRSSSE